MIRTTLGDPNAVAKVVSTILSPAGALVGAELKAPDPDVEDKPPSTFARVFNSPDFFFWGALAAVGVGVAVVVVKGRRRRRRGR